MADEMPATKEKPAEKPEAPKKASHGERKFVVRPKVRTDLGEKESAAHLEKMAHRLGGHHITVSASSAEDATREAAQGHELDPSDLEATAIKTADLSETPRKMPMEHLDVLAGTLDALSEAITKTDNGAEFVSKEIAHLIKDKGYTPERAKGAAISIARDKGFKMAPEKKLKGSKKLKS